MINIEREFVHFDFPEKVFKANNQNINRAIYYKVDDLLSGRSMEVIDAYNLVFTVEKIIKEKYDKKHR